MVVEVAEDIIFQAVKALILVAQVEVVVIRVIPQV